MEGRGVRLKVKAVPGASRDGIAGWVEEASFVHWERERPALPGVEEVRDRLREEGRLSPVDHPSEAQAAGEIRPEPELQEVVVFRPVDGEG